MGWMQSIAGNKSPVAGVNVSGYRVGWAKALPCTRMRPSTSLSMSKGVMSRASAAPHWQALQRSIPPNQSPRPCWLHLLPPWGLPP